MRYNETLLTPIYRLLLDIIERNGLAQIPTMLDEINRFKIRAEYPKSLYNNKSVLSIIDATIALLESYSNGDEIYLKWRELGAHIAKTACVNCYPCRNCVQYYWNELGEIFCSIENQEKKRGVYLPIRKLPDIIENCFDPSLSASALYSSYIKRKLKSKDDNFLLVLKGMSSSTPSLLNSIYDTEEFDGGGFYIRYQGKGIAIDPGYHFVHNLHHYGLSVLDIDYVFVTHEHIDHNNDIRLLDDLHFSVYNNPELGGKHKIYWIFDKVSYQVACIYQKNDTGFNVKANQLYYVDTDSNKICNLTNKCECLNEWKEDQFRASFFATHHIEDKVSGGFKNHTFGIRFYFEAFDKTIAYTSDTAFFPELVKKIGNADCLIANISGIYEDDYFLVKGKQRHLGYFGCYNILHGVYLEYNMYPTMMLISEFWNGKSDIRFQVTNELKKTFSQMDRYDGNILPAEIGMFIDIENLKIRCSQCGKMVEDYYIQRPASYNDKIKVICKDCCF